MSIINRFVGSLQNVQWENVIPKVYPGRDGISKHVLIGINENSKNYLIRYFQLMPGSTSNLERHEADHGVVVIQAKGRVQLNDDFFDIGPLDAIYISSNDLHQFTNTGEEPFGFICVITPK